MAAWSRKAIGLCLLPLFLVAIAALALLNLPGVFEPPYVLAALNTVFLGIFPFIIAGLAFRVYQKRGSLPILVTGGGMLVFGLGSVAAGWVNPFYGGPNLTVTIHNSCACASGLLVLTGAVLIRPGFSMQGSRQGITRYALAFYLLLTSLVALFIALAVAGQVPVFFAPEAGPTPVRQMVLEAAILFFAVASVFLLGSYRDRRSDYIFWNSVFFALVAIGLLAVFFQPSVGSLIGWVGRTAQYLGCILGLYAVFLALQTATAKGLSVEDIVADFYRDAEGSYRQLVESAPDAIITFDDDLRILLWNPAAARMFGYPVDEATRLTFSGIIADDRSLAAIRSATGSSAAGTNSPALLVPIEISVRHRDGTVFPADISLSLRDNESGIICTGIIRDLTVRKKAEILLQEYRDMLEKRVRERTAELAEANRELAESEEKYRRLFAAENDAIFLIDRSTGGILEVNDAACRIYGYTRAEMLGLKNVDVSAEPHETAKAMTNFQVSILNRLHRKKDGSVFPVDISSSMFAFHDREVVLAAVRDVTERKRTEDALRLANHQLNLLGSITRHDILNKVSAILGFVKILKKRTDDPELVQYINRMDEATRMIRSQIAFTRIYQDIGSHEPVWQDLDAVLPRSHVPAHITMSADLHGFQIWADPLLERVLFNLLDNSVRHGKTVTDIQLSATLKGEDLLLVWEDNGIGVPEEDKQQIFERGYGTNSGLGLFLVREILSLTGMTIRECGEPGRGARFEILVPKGAFRQG